ncbi:MAG TPA: hypothetical protein VIH35_09960 [Kiritimatiellia bacterium]|jgi:hypothetical protein
MQKSVLILATVLSTAGLASACDVCATYIALADREAVGKTSVNVFEQYSKIDAPRSGGDEFEVYHTQISVGHRLNGRWAVQAGLPWLDKELNNETEEGIGDATLVGVFRAYERKKEANVLLLDVYAGLKLPTGNTDPLEEERDAAIEAKEHEEHGHEEGNGEHADSHHLALGSGSYDGIFGVSALAKAGRWLGLADVQYRLATEGDFDFEYGDAINARLGAQYYALLEDAQTLAVGVDATGDWRDENEVLGETQEDSDVNAIYVGPGLAYTYGGAFRAAFAWDIAVDGENEGLHGAADKRWRANVSWLF